MKKMIAIVSILFLMVLLLFVNWDGFLNGDRLINSTKSVDENSRNISGKQDEIMSSGIKNDESMNNRKVTPREDNLGSSTTDNALASDRPKLNIGFLSRDIYLYFSDSDLLKEYLEREFDFNFDNANCDFTFTQLSKDSSFIYDEKIDIIFADNALDWEGGEATSKYSIKTLYDVGYSLKPFDSYFAGKEGLFSQFYDSLKELTEDHIYFYPALIGFDGNNESLVLSLKNDKNSKGEVVVSLEPFYNDKYYLTKRGGPANLRFAKTGEYTISAAAPFIVNSAFKQTVYVTSDKKEVNIFLDMVFDSKRLKDQYSRKLKIHGEQIELCIPTFYVENLKNLFDEVLVENVSYDLDSIYHCNKVKITYLAKDFELDFDFRK